MRVLSKKFAQGSEGTAKLLPEGAEDMYVS
jgi:hypothetical protein